MCELANSSKAQAVDRMVRLLTAFESEVTGEREQAAHGMKREVRILLRYVAGLVTKPERSEAERMLSEPRVRRLVPARLPRELRVRGLKHISDFRMVKKKDEDGVYWLEPKPETKRFVHRVPDYRQPLDPILHFILDFQERRRSAAPPVRLCPCDCFFLASGRRRWCTSTCKWKHHQMSREERRDFQAKYRAARLPLEAVQAWRDKVTRRKMPLARKRRLVSILVSALRERGRTKRH
jgi:hypothetical protein